MAFFSTAPNLPNEEKARLEFHFQQLAECVGVERFQLPVLKSSALAQNNSGLDAIKGIASIVGEHLDWKTEELTIDVEPKPAEQCGGGG